MSQTSERFINPAISSVPPSAIRRFFDVAGTMKDTISLGVGEPDFVTPFPVRSTAIDSLLDGETQYTTNAGIKPLREEISRYMSSRFSLEYDPESEILVTVGASEAIDIAMRALVSPGDEVLIPEPCYISYAACARFAGGTPVYVPTRAEEGFELRADDLEARITPRSRVLMLSYPNNPTGGVMPKEKLAAVAEVAKKHDLFVLSDEIYSELAYNDFFQHSIASLPGMRERTMVISGFSKAFAMTGFRLGYLCAPEPIVAAVSRIHQYTIMCASRQSQVAAWNALRQGRQNNYAEVQKMRESYDRRRRLTLQAFTDMGLPAFEPKGAFYMFPSIKSTGLTSDVFCERLLLEKHVVCVPGGAFGESGEGHIRCCYATATEKLLEAFERISAFLGSL
ncbi:MAG TPA: aminotransferase class I/II-fold pyridoxal phosphate-dependent enzyme [Candidatus Limnocylindria bacterium]|nr:aminotransferase class I/II-fold pyridoxal phosphate-dependent enzyme [Candidatus Limnocylindria bacterium]